jgi:hypothetical protein
MMDRASQQIEFLRMPVGEPGSGVVRYAAAMHFYQSHLMTDEVLEVFRICAPDDNRDPIAELAHLGIPDPIPALRKRKIA